MGSGVPVRHPVRAIPLLLYTNTPVAKHPIPPRAALSGKVGFLLYYVGTAEPPFFFFHLIFRRLAQIENS